MGRITQAVTNHPAHVKDYGFGESKEKKTPYIWVEYIFDGVEDDDGSEVTIRDIMYLTDKTVEFVTRELTTLGWGGTNIWELHPSNTGHFSLKGAKALLTVEMQEYEGKLYPKVKFVNDPDYHPADTIDESEVKKIGESLKAKMAAIRAKEGLKPRPKTDPEPVFEASDSKIPF